jgi:hypothetical protein
VNVIAHARAQLITEATGQELVYRVDVAVDMLFQPSCCSDRIAPKLLCENKSHRE